MKTVLFLLAFVASIGLSHAGSFGGPPPFTNGSPLVTGVDGSYQATARGTNLTGVFRFTYAGGVQTSSPTFPTGTTVAGLLTDPYNDYVFFANGFVYRGLVQANINVNSLSGVFDNGGSNVPNTGTGSGATTYATIQAFMNGYFNGSMDQNSPNASFQGTGSVSTYDINQVRTLVPGTGTNATNPPVFNTVQTITFSEKIGYKFRGVRATT